MKKQKGIGLLELMLALAIISVLLVAATRYFASTDSSRKVNDAANMLQVVINASEDWWVSAYSYAGVTFSGLQDRGLIPVGLDASTGNPWGGGIAVDGTTTAGKITMTLTKVRKEDCKALSDLMNKKGVAGSCGEDAITTYTGIYSS